MATLEIQVEGLTQIDITDSSAPTQDELSQHIKDAVRCTINKIVAIKPKESMKFASTQELSSNGGISINGQILGVVRGQSSTSILKAATEIPHQLRYDVTDTDSLRYRSSYNPAFYQLDGKIYVLPIPDSNSKGYITQLSYDTQIDCTSDESIFNFPDEYLNLIILYSAALTCQSAASDIQNNLPDRPDAPQPPNFDLDDVELPQLPAYTPPELSLNTQGISTRIARDDFDGADKELSKFEKEMDIYKENHNKQDKYYQKELEVFKSDLDILSKNKDRSLEKLSGEYRSEIYKYQYDIMDYSQELQEKFTKYKWFMGQYVTLMNEYNENILVMMGKKQAPKEQAPRGPSKQQAAEEAER